jgi:2',3'-cyclic-nucleotide 2'-phosphodiesterase (5'-nucleotidase family)
MRARGATICTVTVAAAASAVAFGALWDGGRERPPLNVLFTGETAGELEVCVCGGEMLGGVAVRAGLLAKREGKRLLLDTGCMACGTREHEVLRLAALLRGMALMGYDAANIGEYELWLGRDKLAPLLDLGVPIVSANVTGADGELVARPYVVAKTDGLEVAVTGVVARGRYRTGPGLDVGDPLEAMAGLLPEMCARAGTVVVLADLREKEVRELARRFPEVALVLFRGRGNARVPETENRSVIASVTGLGRYVGDVTLTWGEVGSVTGAGTPLKIDKRFRADEEVAAATLGWYKRAEKNGLTLEAALRELK